MTQTADDFTGKLWLRESSRQPSGWKGLSESHLQWHLNKHLQLLNAQPHRFSFHLFCNSCSLFFLEAPKKLTKRGKLSQLWIQRQSMKNNGHVLMYMSYKFTFVEHKTRYCCWPYNKSQKGPKQHWLNLHWLSLYWQKTV